jgi:hypothetical protein
MNLTRAVCLAGWILIFCKSVGAFSTGPPANRTGVGGVYCTVCHRTNELNSGDGSVRISGLPSAWRPGETYRLRVVVSHPTAIRFGFELSATGLNGDQAGDLLPSDGRTFVQTAPVNGKDVQFIEHNSVGSAIGSSNVFQIDYRTPADANFGVIRFNVAGNAANGNGANTGDFIYATEFRVSPLSSGTEPQFVLATRGEFSLTSSGGTAPLAVGVAKMQTASGTPGAGLAFLSYRHGGTVLVSEPGFGAAAAIRSGRIYAEAAGAVNTGVVLANPTSQAASVSTFLTDDSGTNFGDATISIPANSQVAAFLNQTPYFTSGGAKPISDARAFTFSSNVPISATAVRTRLNERSEFMMSALPIADLSGTSTNPISIPHIADGAGWSTEILLTNNSDTVETGTLQFLSPSGQSLTVTLDGQAGNQFNYSIPARSSRRFRTAGSANATATGWVEVTPTGSTRTPTATGVLSLKVNNVTSSETGIGAVVAGNAFRTHAELFGNYAAREAGSTQTGVAISNRAATAVTVTVEVTNFDGSIAGSTSVSIPARGQVGLLLGDIPGLPLSTPFTGIIWVSAPSGSSLSVAGLRARFNERATPDLLVTSYPAFDESATPAAEALFSQVVNSGGYSTQVVLIGARGGSSSGTLRFISQSGQPIDMSVR